MFQSTSDIHVSSYTYNHAGLYIEYTVKGDPREYHYLLPREEAEKKMDEIGNEPEADLCQYDAILLVSNHLHEKRKSLRGSQLLDQMTANVCTDLLNRFNVHRTH